MLLYKKTQYGKLVIIILIVVVISILTPFILQSGNYSIPWFYLASIVLLLLLVALTFYKLTITIDHEKIEAKFGVGLLKRSLKIKNINYDSI